MKHFERFYFGAAVIALIIFAYMMITWYILAEGVGIVVGCYAIGYALDRLGIIDKIGAIEKDDTQKYDDY